MQVSDADLRYMIICVVDHEEQFSNNWLLSDKVVMELSLVNASHCELY